MQLDIFADSQEVTLQNAAVVALVEGNLDAGRAALTRLRANYGDNAALPQLAGLQAENEALVTLLTALPGMAALHDAVSRIEQIVLPTLPRILGEAGTTRWRRRTFLTLANAGAGLPFSRNAALGHAGYTYLRADELDKAREAIKAIASWRGMPEPLAWMTEIALQKAAEEAYWPLLAELAWMSPSALKCSSLMQAMPSPLARLYRAFLRDQWGDAPAWFPAWALIEQPDLASHMRLTEFRSQSPAASATRVLLDLTIGERGGLTPHIIEQRKRLRDIDAPLFELYMQRR